MLDVFTDRCFTGNPLAVVLWADDLSPNRMQIIAREFNLSETIFVKWPRSPVHRAHVRSFFPTAETHLRATRPSAVRSIWQLRRQDRTISTAIRCWRKRLSGGTVLAAAGVESIHLYSPGEDCDFRARMLSPTEGFPEDPAPGSAGASLAAQLLASGALPEGEIRLTLQQGMEMGRPSVIGLTACVTAGRMAEVRSAGGALPVSEDRIKVL